MKLAFAFSLFAATMFAGEWTGTISDSKCAAAHADASEKSMKCAQACVKGGKDAVLVVDGKVFKLDGAAKVAEHVGHKVVVNGDLHEDTIKVATVKMAS